MEVTPAAFVVWERAESISHLSMSATALTNTFTITPCRSQAVLSLPILPQRRLCITPLGYAKQNGTEVLHCVSGGCFARWSVSVCVVLSPGFLAYKLLNLFHMHCLRESSRSLAHPTGSACLLQATVFVERLVPPHCGYLGWIKAISP